ncbi:MAG: SAM-dependent methyltransferase, partial [Planctomycetes bacterium]|nr:SAM-dependent methyltransferase [Planctomycetota bacterium]
MHRVLERLELGELDVNDSLGERRFGRPDGSGLHAALRVHDQRFYRRVLLKGSLGAAESYIDHEWSSDDLSAALSILA